MSKTGTDTRVLIASLTTVTVGSLLLAALTAPHWLAAISQPLPVLVDVVVPDLFLLGRRCGICDLAGSTLLDPDRNQLAGDMMCTAWEGDDASYVSGYGCAKQA